MKKKFFAFMLQYGLGEFDSRRVYVVDPCIIYGSSMDELFREFCKANNYKEDDKNWYRNLNGEISYWGLPVCFIKVDDDFELDNKFVDNKTMQRGIDISLHDLFLQKKFTQPFFKPEQSTINPLKQSKFWDCEFSMKELVEKTPECILNTKFKPHKSDDSYGLLCLYFPVRNIIENPDEHLTTLPNSEFVFEVGISYDGFVYNGTTTVPKGDQCKSLYVISTEKAIEIMLEFQKCVIARDIFANKLVTARTSTGNTLREDCVNIVLSNEYTIEKKYQNKDVKTEEL